MPKDLFFENQFYLGMFTETSKLLGLYMIRKEKLDWLEINYRRIQRFH